MGETLFGHTGAAGFEEGFESTLATNSHHARLGSKEQQDLIKVAAYVRVSTLSDEQEDSLENQTTHYSRYIRTNPNWKMTGIYSDHGKSGTAASSRSGFNQMIRHALEGKIDLILCKSVSRFARNVLDTLDTVRMLKENGVRVIFEKEAIDTESMQSEFILTMMAAVAQEESRSISENIKWAYTKRMERGEPRFHRLLGYVQEDKRKWLVQPEEAEIVREAFELCTQEKSPAEIARIFVTKGYKTVKGNKEWSGTAIREILKNNHYIGEVLGQKMYTDNHLSHKSIRNRGEKKQYLIENHHEPIIDKETFQKAQLMLKKRAKPNKRRDRKQYPLSSRIVCGGCGGNLQRFECRGVVTWRCGKSVKSKDLCNMEGIREENIMTAIIAAFENKYESMEEGLPISKVIQKMLREIKNVDAKSDIEYNQLRGELESILHEENVAILTGADEVVEELKTRRVLIESVLKEKEKWWELLEADFSYRINASRKLENYSVKNTTLEELLEELKNIEYLRAWVVRVKALSPILFSITWVTGEEIEVELCEE
ncbi:recombinase family protein [Schinkia azotoformans]|uniref:recombinase family protein n=1 Tax=Schinkia azotoformans TaxID=1454 RepID=UPI002DB65221|nr:recombinase family protein [Schinkia azotoformans]MEC1771957.1 recombinase family protein [Schinkia azotoformans]MED4366455.1 recombinase family protein [Schinkia azotoformans]